MIQFIICLIFLCLCLNNSSSSTLCKENSNCQSFIGSDKENLYIPIIYHIFLPTVGRTSIFLQLQSLYKQLISSDILTIIFDGKLNTGGNKQELEINNFIKLFKCKVNIIIEENNRGYWGNGIRNLYKSDLIGDYIWFIDDDDVVTSNSMDIIRRICKDRSKNSLYLFNTITNSDGTYWEYDSKYWEKDQLLHYRTAHSYQGIIPINVAKKSFFGLQQDGDRLFFNNLKQYLNSIQFINETIYFYRKEISFTIINHFFNIANENILSTASRDDWIQHEKESSNLDNILYRELVVKTCNELNLRLKNLHFHNCAKYSINTLKLSVNLNKFNDLYFYYHPLSKETLHEIFVNEINLRSNNILIKKNNYSVLTSNIHMYNLEMIDIRKNDYWQTITNIYIISYNDLNFQLFEKRWKSYGLGYNNTYRISTKISHDFKSLYGVEANINNIIDILKSHIAAISHFLNSDKQYSMILNDNFSFIDINNVSNVIINIFNYFGDILNVLYLVNSNDINQRINICPLIFQNDIGICEGFFKNIPILEVNKLFPLSSTDSTTGYILSKSYAMKLLRKYIKILTYLNLVSYLDNEFIEDYYLNLYEDDETSNLENNTILLPIGKHALSKFDIVIHNTEKKYNLYCSNNSLNIITSFNSLSKIINAKKIISIDVRGGLGNQLFMIFATLSFAFENNFYYNLIRHSSSFNENSVNFWSKFLSQISYSNNTLTRNYNYHHENDPFLFEKIPITSNKIHLMGYYQNEQYFYPIKDIILPFLLCGLSIEDKLLIDKIMKEIDLFAAGRVKVFVHIRRGDYLLHPNHHNIIPETYYRNSISIMSDKISKILNNNIIQNNTNNFVKNEVLYIFFSDDTEYVKNTFQDLGNNFFSIDNGYPDYIILIIMSLLDGGITANSSFSWWGAYLQKLQKNTKLSSLINKEALIIAPQKWFFENSTVHTPKEWILVD
jgi:hypothetical protein